MKQEKRNKIQQFIEAGSEIVGTTAGAAIGWMFPESGSVMLAGAAAAPILSHVIGNTCSEFYDRLSGRREKARGGATATYAIMAISDRLKRGEFVRQDGFFDSDSDRSSAEEILEGVVIKSRGDHEEKKIRFYSNIFVTAAFDPKLSPDMLNFILATAENLTYRQLCLLNLFGKSHEYGLRNRDYRTADEEDLPFEAPSVLAEVFSLFQRGLILYRDPSSNMFPLGMTLVDIVPSFMVLTGFGKRIHYAMNLADIPSRDAEPVAEILR